MSSRLVAATTYCARLLAEFGADVQKLESPAGDPFRNSAPFTAWWSQRVVRIFEFQ
ncbi:CoA transferase [Bradyrhizobium zhanjiangense]|uniref:CoA transferase n=1 Tax=Bradyrhizobium zhanjiangense TaxID=1325107 RepID=UPI003D318DA4